MAIQSARRTGAAALTVQVAEIQAQLRRDGLTVADMRSTEALEMLFAGVPELGMPTAEPHSPRIERIEHDPIVARTVPPAPTRSRLRYFLDGSQRTMPVWRVGLVPITTTVAAAALLRRNDSGEVEIAPGMLRFRHAWLIPRRVSDPSLDAIIAQIEDAGGYIVDPLANQTDDEYAKLAGDYGKLIQASYVAARGVREDLEFELLDDWGKGRAQHLADDWLVVDGRLRLAVPNAIGLVKSLMRQQLSGSEAVTVFGLPPGDRTTAFRAPDDYHRDPGPRLDLDAFAASGQHDAPVLWYLRMHDAMGQDARHALVRVEVSPKIKTTAEYDEISAWLLAERAPRAVSDVRWATLLYPIHLLERILKSRVNAFTRGWPGTR